jgi:hypothetical protein
MDRSIVAGMVGPKRGRAERRERARVREHLARELDRLARLEPGGAPEHPLMIGSPVLVEMRALAKPCLRCGGSCRLEAHTAEVIDGVRLRVAKVACTSCGSRMAIYFRLDPPTVH